MWTQCTSVTDRRTDRQTDRIRPTITKTVQRIASHGKNLVRNLGALPKKIERPKNFKIRTKFRTTSQLDREYLRNETVKFGPQTAK